LKYEDVAEPTLFADGLLIDVAAIAIQGGDTLNRLGGALASKPHIVGYQASGTVREVGANTKGFTPGQAIYAIGSGRMVATDAAWYRSLPRLAWQPPSFVFGIIWPYNFAMLVVATWLLATLFTIPLLVLAFRASPVLGFAFLPYQLWLAVATSLAFGFAAQ
jgi:hypothetical protein